MSVQSQVERIKGNITNAYTKLEEKGATIPTNKNSANLAETISSLPTSSAGDNLGEMVVTQSVENDSCTLSLTSTGASENKKVVGQFNNKLYIMEV